jgi:hypothetical protein
LSIFPFGQEYLSLQFAVQLYFLLLFLYLHKSHSSSHSFTPFPQTGTGEIFVVHLIEQLFLLLDVQLSHQSSQSSQLSTFQFQHTAFVLVHSKEHFELYQLLSPLSHSSQISFLPFQHFALHFSPKSTGHVKQFSPKLTYQFQQLGFSGSYVVHI